MAYKRQTFTDFDENDPLTAAKMNHIESGIVANEKAISEKVSSSELTTAVNAALEQAKENGDFGSGVIAQPNQPTETDVLWLDTDDESSVDTYTKAEIDAMFGSYITDIDTLVGGDA